MNNAELMLKGCEGANALFLGCKLVRCPCTLHKSIAYAKQRVKEANKTEI